MSQPEKRNRDRHDEWTKPEVKRLSADGARGASNNGQDYGFGQS